MVPGGQDQRAGHRAYSALYIGIVLRVEFKETRGQLNTGMNSSQLRLDSTRGGEAQKYLSHFLKENAQICKHRGLFGRHCSPASRFEGGHGKRVWFPRAPVRL